MDNHILDQRKDGYSIDNRINMAQYLDPVWDKLLPNPIQEYVEGISNGLAVPQECIIFPLLTSAAGALCQATIKLGPLWTERAIFWTAISPGADINITKVLNYFTKAGEECRESENAEETMAQSSGSCILCKDEAQSQDKLIDFLFQNQNGSSTYISKAVDTVFSILASNTDCSEALNNGFSRPQKIYHGGCTAFSSKPTHINITGFIEQEVLLNEIEGKSEIVYRDQLGAIICPRRRTINFKDVSQAPNKTMPSFSSVLSDLASSHDNALQYTLDAKAETVFADYYNFLEDQIMTHTDSNPKFCRMLQKAQGQVARLSLICHCLQQTILSLSTDVNQPTAIITQISEETVQHAIALAGYCLQIKMALFPDPPGFPQLDNYDYSSTHVRTTQRNGHASHTTGKINGTAIFVSCDESTSGTIDENLHGDFKMELDDHQIQFYDSKNQFDNGNEPKNEYNKCFKEVWVTHPKNVRSLLIYGRNEFDASFVAQRKLMPPVPKPVYVPGKVPNKYPVDAAKAYLQALARVGLGDIVNPLHCAGRRPTTMVFRKRKYNQLGNEPRKILNYLHVTEEEYKKNKF